MGEGRAHNLQAILEASWKTAGALKYRIPTSALNEELDAGMDAVTTRFDDACLAHVDIAEANGIAIDVACVDDE